MNRAFVAAPAAVVLALVGIAFAMAAPPPPKAPELVGPVDVDLTRMSGTIAYSQVFDMVANPGSYRGKRIRMRGTYQTFLDEESGVRYHACFISDAAACCVQGIEFLADDSLVWPDDYPKPGHPFRLQGVFETYFEGQNRYIRLARAELSFPGARPMGATNAPPAAATNTPAAPPPVAPAATPAAPAAPAADTNAPAVLPASEPPKFVRTNKIRPL